MKEKRFENACYWRNRAVKFFSEAIEAGNAECSEEWKEGIREYVLTMWKEFCEDGIALNFDQYVEKAKSFKSQIGDLRNFIDFSGQMYF